MPSQIDQYTLLKTLGSGVSAKVKLAQDPSGQQVALKVFDLTNPSCNEKILAALRREVQVYKGLDHANIVRLIDFKENSEKIKENGQKKKVSYIVLELISGGELFDYVALKPFEASICRYYFR